MIHNRGLFHLLWFFILFSWLVLFSAQAKELLTEQSHNEVRVEQVLEKIRQYYVEDIPEQVLLEAAMQGISEQLDEYSSYLDSDSLEDMMRLTRGRYHGLGLEVEIIEDHIVVVRPIANSPAANAGIQKGDRIIAVNNQPLSSDPLAMLSDTIENSGNDEIRLQISRDNNDQPLTFALRKQAITMFSTFGHFDQDNKIIYLKINGFRETTKNEMLSLLADYSGFFQRKVNGLILDMRDNPGGLLSSAIDVADLFLSDSVIISTRGRFQEANVDYMSSANEIMYQVPITVLINEQTASAAEIVAVALQDNNRATVLGQPSYGKGSVQSLIPLANNQAALKLTTAYYFSPRGRAINQKGVVPDEIHSPTTLDPIAQSQVVLSSISGLSESELFVRDNLVERAYTLIQQK